MNLKQFKLRVFNKKSDFFGLSEKDKRKVIQNAVKDSNREQKELVDKYNSRCRSES
jgi:hypothetical protein